MKIVKKVIDHIEKCYAVTEFEYDGKRHLLCCAEGKGPCRAYDLQGNPEETLWNGPGGVMTLAQFPEGDEPVLLATQGFFSPNDASDAELVYYYRRNERWHCKTLCRLPFLHRFGIVCSRGKKYIVAATLKSANAFSGDWTCPGRVWAAELPKNILQYDSGHPLKFQPVLNGLYKNHGFSINRDEENSYAVIGTENGVYTVYPPKDPKEQWKCKLILKEPASDVLYRDLDHDGEKELIILSPFHGENIKIFKKNEKNEFVQVYEREKKMPFSHAIWGDAIDGHEHVFIGGREGDRELIALYYDMEKEEYKEFRVDAGAGAANCMLFQVDGQSRLICANRETDEVAVYSFGSDDSLG